MTSRRGIIGLIAVLSLPGPVGAQPGVASGGFDGDLTPAQFGAVCDSDGTPGSGADDTRALQAAIEAAEARGATLRLPGRRTMCRTTATLAIRAHLVLAGDYCQPVRNNDGKAATPGFGSWLYFDHPGVGLRMGDATSQVTGVVLADLCTLRNQPALVASGPWTPAGNDFDIVEEQDDLLVRNVMLLNPTKGLSASGRLTVDGLRGQPMQVGLSVDKAYDVPRIANVHWWPFWADNKPVEHYTKDHAEAFRLARADNPLMVDDFAIGVRVCMHLVATPAGVTNKLHVANLDCDLVGSTGWLNEAPGSSGQVANFTTQGDDPIDGEAQPSSIHAIRVSAAKTDFSFAGVRTTHFGGAAVATSGGGNQLVLDGLRIDGWGGTDATAPAIAAGAGDTITIGAGAAITGGPESAPLYGGAGLVSAAVTRRVN